MGPCIEWDNKKNGSVYHIFLCYGLESIKYFIRILFWVFSSPCSSKIETMDIVKIYESMECWMPSSPHNGHRQLYFIE